MRELAVEHLACPLSGAPLALDVAGRDGDHVTTGELICAEDPPHRFPIRSGVPRFVDLDRLAPAQRETAEAFSYKWSRIPTYAHERATRVERERWYCERFGFPRGDPDVRAFLAGARIALEAGTGTGVDTDLLVRNFEGLLFGVDIGDAIDHAYARFRDEPRVVLLQADLGRLPFRAGSFDVISCDQVLHHTADPPETFRGLVRHLRPRGRLLLYVYRVKGPLRERADDYLRGLMTHAPLEACREFSEKVARIGKNLSRLRARVEVEDDIPELGLARGTYDVQRLIYDHVFKCFWNDAYDTETNVMVNFDWYRPPLAFRYRDEDVRAWADAAGLGIERLHTCASGISAIMRHAPEGLAGSSP